MLQVQGVGGGDDHGFGSGGPQQLAVIAEGGRIAEAGMGGAHGGDRFPGGVGQADDLDVGRGQQEPDVAAAHPAAAADDAHSDRQPVTPRFYGTSGGSRRRRPPGFRLLPSRPGRSGRVTGINGRRPPAQATSLTKTHSIVIS